MQESVIKWVETKKEEVKLSPVQRYHKTINDPEYYKFLDLPIQEAREPSVEQVYNYLCWWCNKPVTVKQKFPATIRIYCSDDCRQAQSTEKELILKNYIELKIKVMHERALRFLEKQEAVMGLYKEAANVVLEYALEKKEGFQSSHEMMAAMELVRNKIRIKLQQQIGKHRVDMVIPDKKVVLEIDGFMHTYRVKKDSKRDIEIRKELGQDWEIVRIPTKYIEKNVKMLIPAINEVRKEKQQYRLNNNGLLPEYYSKREKEQYKKLLEM